MNFADIKTRLGELLKNPVMEEISAEAGELTKEFQHMLEKRPVRVEAGGDDEQHDADEDLIEEIKVLVKDFRERMELLRKQRTDVEKNNLKEKQAILAELTRVISEEENISKAYHTFNELKDKWRTIGNVPFDKHHDIQKEFSRLSELFYYNMNIYKELRENDLKKNTGGKQDILERLKSLASSENLRELETTLRQLQKDWDHTGAVLKDKWEEMKTLYWDGVKAVQEKIQQLRDEREKKQEEFLVAKKALVAKAKEIVGAAKSTQKEWEKFTQDIIAIQNEWKTVGYASREENEKIWQEFRTTCDAFFNSKKEFFGELKSVFDDNKKKKQDIIAKAEALKDSADWKDASIKLINLQKEWQKIGSAGKKAEHPLWLQFRTVCDHFFNKKKEHFAAAEVAEDENLKKKEAFIVSLSTLEITGTDEEKIARLNELSKEFNAMGNVPIKERDRVMKSYRDAMEALSNRINIDPNQKEAAMFKSKISSMQSQPNAEYLLGKERQFIREKINRLNDEIVKIENNMGFFGNSKNAAELLKDYQAKIDSHKKEIDALKAKLKLIPKA